jgi:hypothetical protein
MQKHPWKIKENSLNNCHGNMGFLERNKALADLSAEEGSVIWASF